MVVGTLSLVQKGQTSRCSGHSGMVVYGGENIVFGGKKLNQWTVYAMDAVGIVVYGGGDICLWCKKVKPVDAVDTAEWWYMVVRTLSLVEKS